MKPTPEIYRRIVAAKIYIDEHFQDAIDLKQIADNAFMSKFHFHRLFKQIYRITPHQYLVQKRMHKAKLLLSENEPVSDVCNEIGYESLASFSILFKKEIGFAPQYYRNLAYKKKLEQAAEPRTAVPSCFFSAYFTMKARNQNEGKIQYSTVNIQPDSEVEN